ALDETPDVVFIAPTAPDESEIPCPEYAQKCSLLMYTDALASGKCPSVQSVETTTALVVITAPISGDEEVCVSQIWLFSSGGRACIEVSAIDSNSTAAVKGERRCYTVKPILQTASRLCRKSGCNKALGACLATPDKLSKECVCHEHLLDMLDEKCYPVLPQTTTLAATVKTEKTTSINQITSLTTTILNVNGTSDAKTSAKPDIATPSNKPFTRLTATTLNVYGTSDAKTSDKPDKTTPSDQPTTRLTTTTLNVDGTFETTTTSDADTSVTSIPVKLPIDSTQFTTVNPRTRTVVDTSTTTVDPGKPASVGGPTTTDAPGKSTTFGNPTSTENRWTLTTTKSSPATVDSEKSSTINSFSSTLKSMMTNAPTTTKTPQKSTSYEGYSSTIKPHKSMTTTENYEKSSSINGSVSTLKSTKSMTTKTPTTTTENSGKTSTVIDFVSTIKSGKSVSNMPNNTTTTKNPGKTTKSPPSSNSEKSTTPYTKTTTDSSTSADPRISVKPGKKTTKTSGTTVDPLSTTKSGSPPGRNGSKTTVQPGISTVEDSSVAVTKAVALDTSVTKMTTEIILTTPSQSSNTSGDLDKDSNSVTMKIPDGVDFRNRLQFCSSQSQWSKAFQESRVKCACVDTITGRKRVVIRPRISNERLLRAFLIGLGTSVVFLVLATLTYILVSKKKSCSGF
ncbi:hypothetical protein EGW08_016963, partial [Elysia chlorotica]